MADALPGTPEPAGTAAPPRPFAPSGTPAGRAHRRLVARRPSRTVLGVCAGAGLVAALLTGGVLRATRLIDQVGRSPMTADLAGLRPGTGAAGVRAEPAAAVALPAYGSTVEVAAPAPADPMARPAALAKRSVGSLAVIHGEYTGPPLGVGTGEYVLDHRADNVTITGRGYVRVHWDVVSERTGLATLVEPTFTGLQGRLFHVASGGAHRMDDTCPGEIDTFLGLLDNRVLLPAGAQAMWPNEYYYLDGQVTITNHESGAEYSLTVSAVTWDQVNDDVTTGPPADPADRMTDGWVRYGLVRDTGDDAAPVPQYTTRRVTWDPALVPQRSKV